MSLLNGVDLEGLHELGLEFHKDPWEAQLGLGVEAAPDGSGQCLVRTDPIRLGTTRAARPFVFEHGCGAQAAPGTRSPLGSVLAALGACVASIVATSLTSRGLSPSRLEVLAHALRPATGVAGDSRPELGLEIHLDGDIAVDAVRESAAEALARSSTLRTLEQPNEFRAVVVSEENRYFTDRPCSRPAGAREPAPATAERRTARAGWEAGLLVLAEVDGVSTEVDQPKQLFGADRAPSAQEHLLAALAAEALGYATDDAAEGGAGTGPSTHASARLDLRGPDSPDTVPVGLCSLLVQFLPGSTGEVRGDAAETWLAEGEVLRLVRDEQRVTVGIVLNGTPVHD